VETLEDPVTEGGNNFSVGQRQLLVIARALLHGSAIVIMDEATASVDAETDSIITETMRREFSKATVITVAHRLNTIMDSDYILVMSDGVASEFDTPASLIGKGGLFRELVRAAARD
jgi:ATP-binding cassette subfamily C (CFTR/MRP) protein 1